ncbi:MAG TPA: ergothioneine biosynthesis protein EgtB [Mycobacteriales bacterium]|nr:ergothioneine biosynthesis protein EgtB [Mycobacteriales bacterium]
MTAGLRERLAAELSASRTRTATLTDVVDEADLCQQHSPLMSPLVWDMAHVGNYEELWLARAAGGLPPLRPELDDLYDAFAHPRADRPALPTLGPAQARAYLRDVRDRAFGALERANLDPDVPLTGGGFVQAMVFQHEHQHDETMLATHQLRAGAPVLTEHPAPPAGEGPHDGPRDVLVAAGPFTMGTSLDPWAYDNERPAHAVDVPAFRIDRLPVSNADFSEFIAAGGYREPRYWSPQGWAHRAADNLAAPMSWAPDEGGWWTRRRFGRFEALPPHEPVQHVSFHEAQAYAGWRGRRLPTEAEWEKAAGWDPAAGRSRRFPWGDADPTPELANLAFDSSPPTLRPAPVGAYRAGASAYGVEQLVGDVWEWCSSPFRSYPGFRSWPYQEYSQVFFGPEYRVLRGGSWATHPTATRCTFRNWDFPIRRQIFAGFRTAVSVTG